MLKVGDRVRATSKCDRSIFIGATGKVTDLNKDGTYETDISYSLSEWREEELELIEEVSMKHYRVLKDTPLWVAGAIISNKDKETQYVPISDLWDRSEATSDYHEGYGTVEAPENSDFFERVYEASHLGKLTYVTKEKARELATKFFNGDNKGKKSE